MEVLSLSFEHYSKLQIAKKEKKKEKSVIRIQDGEWNKSQVPLSPEFLERGKSLLFQVVQEDNCWWMAIIYVEAPTLARNLSLL